MSLKVKIWSNIYIVVQMIEMIAFLNSYQDALDMLSSF